MDRCHRRMSSFPVFLEKPDSLWCSQDLPGLMIYGARPEKMRLLYSCTAPNDQKYCQVTLTLL